MLVYLQMIDNYEDQWKFEELYLNYRDYMYQIAFSILNNSQDAEDAVHDAFVRIAENIEKIEASVGPKTKGYIAAIVENKAIDLYRRKRKHPQVEYADEILGIQVEYTGENGLAECILKLPARQRSIVILRYSYGYSLKEIARILGLAYGNVMKADQRAKAKLKILCKEAGIEW